MRFVFREGSFILFLLALVLKLGANNGMIAPGALEGYVFNYYGVPVSGAFVGTDENNYTLSGADGFYFLGGLSDGEQNVGCGKAGYNTTWSIITIVSADTVNSNFTLTQPTMVVNPLQINQELNPGEYLSTPVSILNNGSGPLNWIASVNYYSTPSFPCQYTIALYDTWGDGWNGCSIDVLVNNTVVLDNITLQGGTGPANFTFDVYTDDQVTTDFNPGPFSNEPYYYIYNSSGDQVWFAPAGNNGPPDLMPGQLIAFCSAYEWISLDANEGVVQPFGGVQNLPVHLNASGMEIGDQYEAEIIFSSDPDVGEAIIPISLTVLGNEIVAPDNLNVQLIDYATGKMKLSWTWNQQSDAFQFFLIKRDGAIIATTTHLTYFDIPPQNGNYCYTVQSVYNEGFSAPAGPVCEEWPNPNLMVNPADLEGWVWPDFDLEVFTTISNNGEGTLSYSFPEFAAMDILSEPGYTGERGAGGPDAFGYVWIDSDEAGGPDFSYTDISTSGTPVFGLSDDNIVGPFNIGFDFYFYGQAKDQFWINSNGCIGFNSNYITIGNTAIPTNSSVYNDFIAWMWDDLVCRPGSSQVFYQSFADHLIIQFKNYEHINSPNLPINAEVVIYKNGKILIIYDSFAPGIPLNSCTVGIQSSSPWMGLQVALNSNYLHDELTVFLRVPGDFITDVEPSSGLIPENSSQVITITYDAEDLIPGPYTHELILQSNDPEQPEFLLNNTMYVYSPGIIRGQVTDNDTEEPLIGVSVTAGPYQAITGEEGIFTLPVDEGLYDLVFAKLGYMPDTVEQVEAVPPDTTILNIGLWDDNYAPSFVQSEILDDDSFLMVTWGQPQGPYEMILDDGEAEDFFVYNHAGSWNAVKFTPAAYPLTVIGGSFYVGDGSFPGPFLGTEFGVAVFDDDGINGLPGTLLDSNGVTVNNSGWVNIDWLSAFITEGSFYLAMYQSENVPNAAPIGVDMDVPLHYRSYSKFQASDWSLSPMQDFMIRAWMNGPEGNVSVQAGTGALKSVPKIPANWKKHGQTASGTAPIIYPGRELSRYSLQSTPGSGIRDLVNFRVANYVNFNVDDPLAGGDYLELATTQGYAYTDATFEAQPEGWYIFAVKAQYSSGLYSDYTLSNIVGHKMQCAASFTLSLTTGQVPENVEVTMTGLDYPRQVFHGVTGPDGQLSLDPVWKGTYNIKLQKIGFEPYYIENVIVNEDVSFNIILIEKKYSPGCLFVDPVTLIGTWCEPKRTAISENFESGDFPPSGWQVTSADDQYSWFLSNDASSEGFQIPPWDSYYAVVNNDTAGTENNGCCDYLITPPIDLRESEGYALYFDSFYTGAYGQMAFIEYSTDEGETWELFRQLEPDSVWARIEIDLEQFSGNNGPPELWIAFHSDMGPYYGSGWAIDNVLIQVPAPPADYLDFSVFLDDAFIGVTSETQWDFAPLAYGQIYEASVAARFSSGLSAKDNYIFESKYLFPPQNLSGAAPDDAALLTWDPPGPALPYNLLGYQVYRNDQLISYLPHQGEWEPQGYIDSDLDPGIYPYTVTGVYDLTPYGLPGETGESMREGPEILTIDYCAALEFFEGWELGSYEENSWLTDGPNWAINGQTGNPAPVAEFSWNPVQSDYSISLESYPLCAVSLTEGDIWLDFDLAMYLFQATGQEFLEVQIWGWDDQVWETVAQYTNTGESYSWTPQHISLNEHALGKIFKVRFLASGRNSMDVRGWFVDNIHIYRKCGSPPEIMIDPGYYEGYRLVWVVPELGKEENDPGSRELTGYNVFRSRDDQPFELIAGEASMPFVDADTGLVMGSVYCYKITAVYAGSDDWCESDFSNEICALWTADQEESSLNSGLVIYPNPANHFISIQSSVKMRRISIFDMPGNCLFNRSFDDYAATVSLAGLPAGIFIVEVETDEGVTSKLLTIQK